MTVGSAFAGGPNNFDLLRLGAALLVLLSHAFVLTGHAEAEPVAMLLGHVTDGGGLGVGAFFVLSGFLIARSAERHPWREYVRARALRIVPGYAAAAAGQVLAMGAAVSALGAGAYLAAPGTWAAVARALAFSPPAGLPGVFGGNPLPGVFNGSLWTLRIEVACYAAALVWAVLGGRRWMLAAVLACGCVALGWAHQVGAGIRVASVLDCLLFFATGMAAWCWRGRVPLRWWMLAVLAGAFAAGAGTRAAPLLWHLVLPYAVLRLGLARRVGGGAMAGLGDISYGTYLWAFPAGQVIAAAVPGIGPVPLAGLDAAVALLCGFVSSRVIERPALRLKGAGG